VLLSGASAPGGFEVGAIRTAAAQAAGPLPVAAADLLDTGRFERPAGELAFTAARGLIAVHAPDAALGNAVLEAAERAAQEIGSWAGGQATATRVDITVLPNQAKFRELTGLPAGVIGVTLRSVRGPHGEKKIFTFAGIRDIGSTVIPHEMTHALAMAAVNGTI